jgi:hypothetical protein
MPDPLKELYERSSTFGRDFFHYVVAALILALAFAWGLVLSGHVDIDRLKPLNTVPTVWGVSLVLAGVVSLYAVGHVLLAIGFLLVERWKGLLGAADHVRRYESARSNVEAVAKRLLRDTDAERVKQIETTCLRNKTTKQSSWQRAVSGSSP